MITLRQLLLFCLLPTVAVAQPAFSPDRLQRIDAFCQGLVDGGIAPNVQTFVAHRGEVVHRGTYGVANLETRRPARPDDIYRIASQTKALVTAGLMRLYENGAFLLQDPIADYIPAFAATRVLKEYDRESGDYLTEPLARPITIEQLLSHTAGIPYGLPFEGHPELDVPFFCSQEAVTTEEVVNRIAARPLVHQPGEGWTYGLGIDVIGRLVEVLSGQPLDEYMAEHVFGPLGMRDSHFYLPESKTGRLVQLYSKAKRADELTLHENELYRDFAIRGARTYFSAGAGSVGTIEDYGRFCRMIANGGSLDGHQLLSPTTVALMARNHSGTHEVWDRKDHFGLGFQLISEDSAYGDQAPPGSLTWGGLYCSEYTIDPENDLVLLIYTNVHPTAHYAEIVRKFRILVYQALTNP